VEVTKEERVEAHVSFWKEKAENNQWRCNQLQSEITKLQSELKEAKAEAWQKGVDDCSNYLGEYDHYIGLTEELLLPEEIESPIMPTNPYKEETKPDFNQNSMLERFGELEDEFKVE